MIFFKRFAMLIYVTILLFFSCSIILLATQDKLFHFLGMDHVAKLPDLISHLIYAIYWDKQLRILSFIFGVMLLILNFMFYQFFSVNVHREKIIAFDNPTGRVSVSLIAMEDLVKRIILKLNEVKDVKPTIKATKRGLDINIRLVLFSDVHIPDVTARIAQLVQKRVQESIGLSEPINTEIYVSKIIPDPVKGKKIDSSIENTPRLNIPFQGYRA